MVMDRRHQEDAPAGALEPEHLDDDRQGFHDKETTDDDHDDLMLGGDGDGADQAAKRQRPRITHEDGGGRRIEPQKAETRADDGADDDGELTRAGHKIDLQVIGENRITSEIGNHAERRGGNHHGDDGQTIETIRQVHGIARADDDESTEEHEEITEIDHEFLEEGKGDGAAERTAMRSGGERHLHHEEHGNRRDQEFDAQTRLAGKTLVALFRDLEIIVVEADGAETERHHQNGDDIDIRQVAPQKRAAEDTGKDHQAAHGRSAGFLEMRLRSIGADRLAFSLANAQRVDDGRSKQEDDQGRGKHRRTGPEGDVPEQVEDLNFIRQFDEPDQHNCPFKRLFQTWRSVSGNAGYLSSRAATILPKPSPSDDFTISASPGCTHCRAKSISSAVVGNQMTVTLSGSASRKAAIASPASHTCSIPAASNGPANSSCSCAENSPISSMSPRTATRRP
ncbi:hypothetical protein AT6N2_C0032 [Agrobacterium tumefaciens]|nr:hypothetical protein AT6N2_C0032 [Agrobacterium tumefaciens]